MKLILSKEFIKKMSGNVIVNRYNKHLICSDMNYRNMTCVEVLSGSDLTKKIMINFDYIKKLWAYKHLDLIELEIDSTNLKLTSSHNGVIEKIDYYDNKVIPDFYIKIFASMINGTVSFENILTIEKEIKNGYIVIDDNLKYIFNTDADNNFIYSELKSDSLKIEIRKGILKDIKIFDYNQKINQYLFYLNKDSDYIGISDNNLSIFNANSTIYNQYKNFKYIINKLNNEEEVDRTFILDYNFNIEPDMMKKILSILNDKTITNQNTYITLTGEKLCIYDNLSDVNIFEIDFKCNINSERVDIPYKLYKTILTNKPENIGEVYKFSNYYLIILKNKNKILINV